METPVKENTMNKEIINKIFNLQPNELCATTGREWLMPQNGEKMMSTSPNNALEVGEFVMADDETYEAVIKKAQEAFLVWRDVPGPKRGEIVRQIGDKLRQYKDELGKLVTYEMGKIYQEGLGEVQEMIDICDFALGLSRQLYGLTIQSERPGHRMMEQWHPLGIVGVITSFNFPVAVWAWNAMIAAVCGDVVIWKPSEKVPMNAIAVQKIVAEVLEENDLPEGIFNMLLGDYKIGQKIASDKRVNLVSATGSTRMGKAVAATVSQRLGKYLLELGGNNAIILTPSADLDMAMNAIVFGAVGTAGQRCTSTRRLIIHSSIYDEVKERLLKVYPQLLDRIGDPLDESTLIGPLIDNAAVEMMKNALEKAKSEGANILFGGEHKGGNYMVPALVEAENHFEIVQKETFAPILYLMKYDTMEEAMQMHNDVPQGLSSAIFSNSILETEYFWSQQGSDCGIANVNIGTSGAEIGGAFGGEKETGGGRESGSDAWKAYMRRQTNTVNYTSELPLAQGIKFDI